MSFLRTAFWRGGVCNALIFHLSDLPKDRSQWQKIFAAAMGSPDPYGRQLNGMGGGNSSLSKICIVSPSQRDDADVDFEFVQVGIQDGSLDMASNCGNMVSAIGPFAVDHNIFNIPKSNGLQNDKDRATVRIYNTNTNKVIQSKFQISGQPPKFQPKGDFVMAGVPGSASKISLAFMSPAGTQTKGATPTDEGITLLDTKDLNGRRVSASLIDIANPGVIVDGEKLGIDPNIVPADLDQQMNMMTLLENIRREGAERMGLDPSVASVPKIVIAFAPNAEAISKGVIIQCIVLSMGQTHKAIPLTLALNLVSASFLEGTIPFRLAAKSDHDQVFIQHPSGIMPIGVDIEGQDVKSASLFSSARLLMQGEVNIE